MSTRAASGSRARLAALRRRVDRLDRSIVRLLAARQRLVCGMLPFKTGLRDARRETVILKSVVRQAQGRDLDGVFAGAVYRGLLAASRAFLRRRRLARAKAKSG
ncbi:MAG: chorismate mutase [Elusimicrobia bacterium]|nr:chorismate mutase [Elusimicrobiota bacterium]